MITYYVRGFWNQSSLSGRGPSGYRIACAAWPRGHVTANPNPN